MQLLLHVGLANALLATALALLVAGISRFFRHPALAHALWLLVLLRLLCPPLWPLPWTLEPYLPAMPSDRVRATSELLPAHDSAPAFPDLHPLEGDGPFLSPPELATQPQLDNEPGSTAATSPWPAWLSLVAAVWFSGVAVVSGMAVYRAIRFQRLVARAEAAPAGLQAKAANLARRFNLRVPPQVHIVRGRIPPLLWAVWRRPAILLPAELLARLDSDQTEALVAHELAHLRRGDRWVRYVEMAALALYWWHPVAWWASRQLRQAEELCCDGWVLSLLPGHARQYARSLLETVAFLSGPRPSVPSLGIGIGQFHLFQRRLTMILAKKSGYRLSRSALCGVLLFAVVVLSFSLSITAEDATEAERPQTAKLAMDREAAQWRTAMIAAASQAFEAYKVSYEVGQADIGVVYSWSRRWMDAEMLAQPPRLRTKAAEEHLKRMEQLHERVAALYRAGGAGGDAATFRASQFYVAEARYLLSQSGLRGY